MWTEKAGWKLLLTAFLFFGAAGNSAYSDSEPPGADYEKMSDGLVLPMTAGKMKVQVLTDSIVRVVYSPGTQFPERESLMVVAKTRPAVKWEVKKDSDFLTMATSKIQIRISRQTGATSFVDSSGQTILEERGRKLTRAKVQGESVYHVQQTFKSSMGEALYGLGQYQDGVMNWAGHTVLMEQANSIAVVPFLLSSHGYGILWDNPSVTTFHNGPAGTAFCSEVADAVDYYFIYGPSADQVIAGYRELTGAAPMFSKWAYGYFQSKERYKTGEELVATVKEYRDRKLPLDVIVQDWMYWEKWGWNAMKFDESVFPDPRGMIDRLHDQYRVHLMISIWPKFGPETEVYREMKANGYLYPYPGLGGAGIYDAFNPGARSLYWKFANEGLFSKGVDAWWMDATEPEFSTATFRLMQTRDFKNAGRTALGSTARYLNAYSLMTTAGVYEGQRAVTSDQRAFILTRSAFAGQQRNAAATWSGDIRASWKVFRKQVPAGLNISMAGIPYWTTDIGGFFVFYRGGCENEKYRELYVRWFQYGTFCPIFRSHGTMTPREIWRFGEKGTWAYDTLEKFDNLRYRLLPYIYSLAWRVTDQGYTMMRGLPMDFPADAKVRAIPDQFMFGPSLLVNPVTSPQSLAAGRAQSPTRKVYLPQSAGWFDFWTGKKYRGGQTIDAPAPMEIMPLFVKAGSIVPMGPFLQYALEKPADPIELRIYPGADAEFTLYEDDGLTYNYEQGERALINMKWDDAGRTLTLSDRQGSFPAMLQQRTVKVILVRDNLGVGVALAENPDQTVIYSGKEITVVLHD